LCRYCQRAHTAAISLGPETGLAWTHAAGYSFQGKWGWLVSRKLDTFVFHYLNTMGLLREFSRAGVEVRLRGGFRQLGTGRNNSFIYKWL